MEAAESSFDGVSFHCYEGTYDQMASFTSAYPDKEIWQTECTGQIGTDWWSNIKVRNMGSLPSYQAAPSPLFALLLNPHSVLQSCSNELTS